MELAVSSGLTILTTMLEEDRMATRGPRYQHQTDRSASRAGTAPSEVVLGGRKVAILGRGSARMAPTCRCQRFR